MIDSFATPSNTLCEKSWDLKSDALSQSRQGALWMNPSFSILDKVVTKIEAVQVECFFVVPQLDNNTMV